MARRTRTHFFALCYRDRICCLHAERAVRSCTSYPSRRSISASAARSSTQGGAPGSSSVGMAGLSGRGSRHSTGTGTGVRPAGAGPAQPTSASRPSRGQRPSWLRPPLQPLVAQPCMLAPGRRTCSAVGPGCGRRAAGGCVRPWRRRRGPARRPPAAWPPARAAPRLRRCRPAHRRARCRCSVALARSSRWPR